MNFYKQDSVFYEKKDLDNLELFKSFLVCIKLKKALTRHKQALLQKSYVNFCKQQ